MAPRGRPPTCDHRPGASRPSTAATCKPPRAPHTARRLWRPGGSIASSRLVAATSAHLHALRERGATVPDTQAPWSSSSEGDSPPWRFHVWRGLQFLSETVRAGESKVQIPFFHYQINKKPRSR